MKLDIITPQESLYSGDVSIIQFPGTDGSFEILNNHAPLVSLLKRGTIKLVNEGSGKEELIEIAGGVVELNNNIVTVLAESVVE